MSFLKKVTVIISLTVMGCGQGFEFNGFDSLSLYDHLPENTPPHVQEDLVVDDDAPVAKQLRTVKTPTRLLTVNEYPTFSDDLDFDELNLAISRQLKRFNKRNMNHIMVLGGIKYPYSKLNETLVEFKAVVEETQSCLKRVFVRNTTCYQRLNDTLRDRFNVFIPVLKKGDRGYGKENFARFTGYYTPTLPATHERTKDNQWGIYNKPSEVSVSRMTREQIDFDDSLIGSGYELFFVKDLYENYLLHIEGGGRVEVLEDGKKKYYYLSYDGTNKQHFEFISKYMVEKGYIDNYSIAAQRKFLENNPSLYREIYRTCPSYVYFKVTKTPPLGSDMVPLTNGRSIALDYRIYSLKGLLSFIQTERLDENTKNKFKSFSRFMIDQDTGGAIRGAARIDIFFGEDDYASRAAQVQHHMGKLFFLVVKD